MERATNVPGKEPPGLGLRKSRDGWLPPVGTKKLIFEFVAHASPPLRGTKRARLVTDDTEYSSVSHAPSLISVTHGARKYASCTSRAAVPSHCESISGWVSPAASAAAWLAQSAMTHLDTVLVNSRLTVVQSAGSGTRCH